MRRRQGYVDVAPVHWIGWVVAVRCPCPGEIAGSIKCNAMRPAAGDTWRRPFALIPSPSKSHAYSELSEGAGGQSDRKRTGVVYQPKVGRACQFFAQCVLQECDLGVRAGRPMPGAPADEPFPGRTLQQQAVEHVGRCRYMVGDSQLVSSRVPGLMLRFGYASPPERW